MPVYHERPAEPLRVLVKNISRHSWEKLQKRHRACRGSYIEHVTAGTYALHIPAGGAVETE
jgi:hypothetical protein